MHRRSLLKSAGAAGAATLLSAKTIAEVEGHSCSAFDLDSPPAFELDELTLPDLQEGMRSGKYTARMLVDKYLDRIDAVDKSGPKVNAVIEINPEARTIANQFDQERQSKGPRGPLHGIPLLVKDNFLTADRMQTTAGSLALENYHGKEDAYVVKRLRDAGAIILGKSNLSEWANFRSSHSTSGWSGRGGQTRNPYALDRNPCGSSSGSGAAVAANCCAAALGTETDGSVVCPSSANGIVGIKPTLGLLSRFGIVPIAHSQDTAGPMARSVRDAAVLLGVAAGVDPRDPATEASRDHGQSDYTRYLDAHGLRGARIGVVRKYFGFSDAVDKLMETAIDVMRHEQAEIVDPAEIPTLGKFDDSELEVLEYEFKADLNAFLQSLGPSAPVKSMKEVIEFNERHRDREMPYFGQDLMTKSEAKGPLTDAAYREALEKNHRLARTEGIDAVMDKHNLDALIAPTSGPAWMIDLVDGDHDAGGSSNLAAVAGYPNINVPAGFIFGLPVGISFFGRAWSEPTLLKIAYAFEQATKHRKLPQFLPTAKL